MMKKALNQVLHDLLGPTFEEHTYLLYRLALLAEAATHRTFFTVH
jgi:hypothetical protein